MLYLNAAGLSPFRPEVQQAISSTLDTFSRLLYSEAGIQLYREILQQSRQTIADWLELKDVQRLAFVPNTTTACRLTLSRINWQPGDTLLTTTHENSTILQELNTLRDRGVTIVSLDPDTPTGLLPAFEQALQTHPVRAIVMSHVSHHDGRIFPIDAILDLANSRQTWLIVDGAQAAGHVPLSFRHFHPHAYFFPGHKWCGGPMGTGVLIVSHDWGQVLAHPGQTTDWNDINQPYWSHFELGTQNIGLIAGLAKASSLKHQEGSNCQTLNEIREEWKTCLKQYAGIRILDTDGPHAPGILAFVCLNEQTEMFIQTMASTHSLAWKTFSHPSFPSHLSVRLSWTTHSARHDIQNALAIFTAAQNA